MSFIFNVFILQRPMLNVFIKSLNLISDGQTKGIEVAFNDLSLFLSNLMLEMDCIIEHFLINNRF